MPLEEIVLVVVKQLNHPAPCCCVLTLGRFGLVQNFVKLLAEGAQNGVNSTDFSSSLAMKPSSRTYITLIVKCGNFETIQLTDN